MNRDELKQRNAEEKPRAVTIKGWGQLHYLSPVVGEIDAQMKEVKDEQAKGLNGADKRAIAKGLARILVNDDGTRMFDPENEEDITELATYPWHVMNKVMAAYQKDIGDEEGN